MSEGTCNCLSRSAAAGPTGNEEQEQQEEEERQVEKEGFFIANAVDEVDAERDRATPA
jgi:hypothetical protein